MTIFLASIVQANDGRLLDLSALPHTLGYTGNNLTTDTVNTLDGHVYTQTFTYDGSNRITNTTVWTFIS